jgi:hypothetical protein
MAEFALYSSVQLICIPTSCKDAGQEVIYQFCHSPQFDHELLVCLKRRSINVTDEEINSAKPFVCGSSGQEAGAQ